MKYNSINNKELKIVTSIKTWLYEFKQKREKIEITLLKTKPSQDIAYSFVYSNLKEKYPDFCPLFKKSKLCHNMSEDSLWCYHCACPHYDIADSPFNEEDKICIGKCRINSKKKQYVQYKKGETKKVIFILSCSNCLFPHKITNIRYL